MDIVVTGYAGLEGSLWIYQDEYCRKKLLSRYPKSFFGVFESMDLLTDRSEKLDTLYHEAAARGLAADASEGGVLAALWRLMKDAHTGGTYAQRAIPVLQQTIEVCEMFGLNPYRLYAPDCRVWLSEDTGSLAREAAPAGVPLRVIGFTSKGVAIKRTDTEADSSLRRPETDELERFRKTVRQEHTDKLCGV